MGEDGRLLVFCELSGLRTPKGRDSPRTVAWGAGAWHGSCSRVSRHWSGRCHTFHPDKHPWSFEGAAQGFLRGHGLLNERPD